MTMRAKFKGLVAATSLVALTACTGDGSSTFTSEAGALVGGGDFGNSTMNNTQVMNGEQSYVVNLNNKFAQDVTTTVTFAFNSAALDADAQAVLSRQASWIRQFPEVRFRVYGHTDLVGSAASNKSLGLRRANAVVAYLVGQGISRSRLEAVVSFGETQPLIVTQGRERRNRRTVTEVRGLVGSNPGPLDGKYAALIYRNYIESAKPATILTGAGDTPSAGQAPE
jgi:peptidoglycan-associated lipoprotein